MEAATPAPEARRFGKYTLVAKLATGGMAEIFLARLHGDGGFEKLVCIKRILPHLAQDPQFVAMFLDEARVAARISHPNVCQVFELGECEGQYYIAMEYLEGVPLAAFRRKDFYPQLPDPRLVAGFGVQACEGLHHAHQLKRPDGELLGVVHRDISAQNLFATVDGVVKVLDFGIAKMQDASMRTSTGAVKGTYAYMAPEQLRNETLDRRVDVWAIGVVLWETLAQRQLFKRDTEFLTFEAITKEPILDLSEARPDVPPLLADTITRALSRRREDRFATARALGEALAQAVAPLGGAASPAQISDGVSRSFEAALAEQRTLLRIAREGGQFDLDTSSPLMAHGTEMATTSVSNIQRRVEEAKAEVAHIVAATQAIDSLLEDEGIDKTKPRRFDTDGAFTPAPSRRVLPLEAPDPSGVVPQFIVTEDSAASSTLEMRSSETDLPLPVSALRANMPPAVATVQARPPSKLPWIIAIIAIVAMGAAGVMFYLEQQAKPAIPAATPRPAPVAAVAPADAAAAEAAEDKPAEDKPAEDKPAVPPPADDQVAVTEVERPVKVVEHSKHDAREKRPSKKVEKKTEKVGKTEKLEKVSKTDKTENNDKAEKAIATPDKPVAGAPGFITIDSSPVYAVIYIDGKKHGETPLVNIKLAAGKHSVRAVSPSGSTKELTIQIEAGKTAPVRRIEW